jgi:hypothetical protein
MSEGKDKTKAKAKAKDKRKGVTKADPSPAAKNDN